MIGMAIAKMNREDMIATKMPKWVRFNRLDENDFEMDKAYVQQISDTQQSCKHVRVFVCIYFTNDLRKLLEDDLDEPDAMTYFLDFDMADS